MRDTTLLLLRLLLLCWPRKLKVGRPLELLLLVLVGCVVCVSCCG